MWQYKLTSLGAYSDQFSSYSTTLSTSLCRKLMRKEAAIDVNCVPVEHFLKLLKLQKKLVSDLEALGSRHEWSL